MNAYALAVLAFAMSMDAFAASIAKGAVIEKPNAFNILKTALIFGVVETVTPLIGWAAGRMAQQFISDWDHWVAFVLLSVLGIKMIYGAVAEPGGKSCGGPNAKGRYGFWMIVVTAVATSIDSMVVGVGLAFLNVNIVATALMIGMTTTLMSAAGIVLGRFFGRRMGPRAEVLGGMVLMLVGASILMEHLRPPV